MERAQFGNKLKVGYATHEGMSGKHNEDFFGVFAWKTDDDRLIYIGVVADGVGGQTAGEVASHVAVSAVQKYFDELPRVERVSLHLEQAILAANEAVYREAQENPEYQGMSTTMCIVGIIDGKLYQAYVGDSRIYMMRDGRLQQISVDHTWAQEAIEAGLLSREQAKTHPNRNVIRRHLGGSLQLEVDHRLVLKPGESTQESLANQGTKLRPGDTLLICSDGLTDMITDASVHESMHKHFFDLPTGAKELVDKANRAGGKDNITLVMIQVPTDKAPAMVPMEPASAGAAAAAGKTTTGVRNKAAVSASATAAAAGPAQARPAATPVAAPAKKSRMPLVLVGIVGVVIVVIVAGVAAFLFSSTRDNDSTPEPTNLPGSEPDQESTLVPGAPATAAILATMGTTDALDNIQMEDTPELIPTLRSTLTATPVTVPTVRRQASPTFTPTARQSGGSQPTSTSSSGPSQPTNTPLPTNTSIPPTNTSVPPTPLPTDTPQPEPPTAAPTSTTEPEPTTPPTSTKPGCQDPPCNDNIQHS